MESQCAFDGNQDIYGLGVRIGIYLQCFTSILAQHLYPSAITSNEETNATYQLAMFSGLILITSNSAESATKALEGFITLLLCFAVGWITSARHYLDARSNITPATTSQDTEVDINGTFGLLFSAGSYAYGVWFLFVGLYQLPRTPCPELVFLFAQVRLFGWFRVLLAVFFLINLAASVVLLFARLILLFLQLARLTMLWNQPSIPSPPQTPLVRIITFPTKRFLASIFALAVFITAIELTLVWNHIRGIYSTATFSQLFPLVVGAVNLARLVYQCSRSYILGDIRIN